MRTVRDGVFGALGQSGAGAARGSVCCGWTRVAPGGQCIVPARLSLRGGMAALAAQSIARAPALRWFHQQLTHGL